MGVFCYFDSFCDNAGALGPDVGCVLCPIDVYVANVLLSLKSTFFWYITPCSPLKVNRRFGGTYLLHLHGLRISPALLAIFSHAGFLLGLFLDSEDGENIFLRSDG
jgi:hypothetical protein